MKFIFIVVLSSFPIYIEALEGGCYISPLVAKDKISKVYYGGELGCEGYDKNSRLFGISLGMMFFPYKEIDGSRKEFVGLKVGITKSFIYKPLNGYKALMPYIGFGVIVGFNVISVTKGAVEYTEITEVGLHSFVPNMGIRLPITDKLNLVPHVQYMKTVKEGSREFLMAGVSLQFIGD